MHFGVVCFSFFICLGKLIIAKVFLGRSVQAQEDLAINPDTYPDANTVFRPLKLRRNCVYYSKNGMFTFMLQSYYVKIPIFISLCNHIIAQRELSGCVEGLGLFFTAVYCRDVGDGERNHSLQRGTRHT